MTDLTPEEQVRKLLASVPDTLSKPCIVERNKPLAAALREHRKQLAEGETHVSLEWLYEKHLKKMFSGPGMTSVRRWSRREDLNNG